MKRTFSWWLICSLLLSTGYAQVAESLEEALSHPKEITVLDLSGQGITSLPEEVGRLKNLEELDLSPERILTYRGGTPNPINGNFIQHLPDAIGKLKNLKRLNLQATDLRILPSAIINLQNLNYLDLSFNPRIDVRTILKVLPLLLGLKYVDLTGCKLSAADVDLLQTRLPDAVIQFQP